MRKLTLHDRLFLVATIGGFVLYSCLAISETPQSRKANPCPDPKNIVNGQDIHRGTDPFVVVTREGEKRTLISVEMALTPLDLDTVAGFKVRAPANVLNRSGECDERNRFRRTEFVLYWIDGKLVPRALLPELPAPQRFEYGHKHVTIFGHFSDPSKDIPETKYIEQRRLERGLGKRFPQFGFTAYTRYKKNRAIKTWDTFILDDIHGGENSEVFYSCEVTESELLKGKIERHKQFCQGGIGIRNGFWLKIRFWSDLLPEAEKISQQIINVMNSYVVK